MNTLNLLTGSKVDTKKIRHLLIFSKSVCSTSANGSYAHHGFNQHSATQVLLAVVLAFFSLSITACKQKHYDAMPEAVAALESDTNVTVTKVMVDKWKAPSDHYYLFEPTSLAPTTGFILYPGGNVNVRSYAPLAKQIAAAGYTVTLVSMPNEIAIYGVDRADKIKTDFPSVKKWAIGGHSVAGTAGSAYAANKAKSIDGVILWASVPSALYNLKNRPLKAISIYGTKNGGLTPDEFKASAKQLPADTTWVEIEGGNHTNFGWYTDHEDGIQDGDLPADISREDQQSQIIQATSEFLNRLSQRQ